MVSGLWSRTCEFVFRKSRKRGPNLNVLFFVHQSYTIIEKPNLNLFSFVICGLDNLFTHHFGTVFHLKACILWQKFQNGVVVFIITTFMRLVIHINWFNRAWWTMLAFVRNFKFFVCDVMSNLINTKVSVPN